LSFEEIARLTGTPATTWKSRFAAALLRLRERLRTWATAPRSCTLNCTEVALCCPLFASDDLPRSSATPSPPTYRLPACTAELADCAASSVCSTPVRRRTVRVDVAAVYRRGRQEQGRRLRAGGAWLLPVARWLPRRCCCPGARSGTALDRTR